ALAHRALAVAPVDDDIEIALTGKVEQVAAYNPPSVPFLKSGVPPRVVEIPLLFLGAHGR
ncbi:hypothetical protein, partial [Pseudomonas sp. GP01-A4]|uniref:hypothetical protein n=1 Tax=Pseudomonas sp. GP01-A4 TaxID=2070571 RepID=UPI001C48B983